MKKSLLILLGILFFAAASNVAFAKTAATNPQTAAAIRLYKTGNYTQSYVACSNIVKKDPSNSLAYYYLAMSAIQLGKKEEGVENYNRVISLSPNGILGSYAKKGIKCAEEPTRCHERAVTESDDDTDEDRFIKSKFGSGFSNKARGVFEQQKMENMMREMNRNGEITPKTFKEYKDFSSQGPTNEEIVSALRTLQQAGFNNIPDNRDLSDLSLILGTQNNFNNSGYDILNLMYNENRGTNANLNPQVIQSLLTNQMTANF